MLARERSGGVVGGVEKLYWAWEGCVKQAKLVEIDVEGVVGVLGGGDLIGLPRCIVEGVVGGGEDLEEGDELRSEYLIRLARMTRLLVKLGLGASQYTRVLKWEDGPDGVCVLVGVENAWSVSVVATGLDAKVATLRAQWVQVFIGSAAGSGGDKESESLLTGDQEQALLAAVDERVFWAVNTNVNNDAQTENDSETQVARRAEQMITAMVEVVNGEIAAPLAMEMLKSQAWKLARTRRKFMRIHNSEPVKYIIENATEKKRERVLFRPNLELEMWNGYRRFTVQLIGGGSSGDVVDVVHTPEIQNQKLYRLPLDHVSLEAFLQAVAMERARVILKNIHDAIGREWGKNANRSEKDAMNGGRKRPWESIFCADGVLPPRLVFPLKRNNSFGAKSNIKAILELGVDLWTGDFKLRLLEERHIPAKISRLIASLQSTSEKFHSFDEERGEVVETLGLVLQWIRDESQEEQQSRCFHASDSSFLRGTMTRSDRTQVRCTDVDSSLFPPLESLSLTQISSTMSDGDNALVEIGLQSVRNKTGTKHELFAAPLVKTHDTLASSGQVEEENAEESDEEESQLAGSASELAAAVTFYEYTTILAQRFILKRALEVYGVTQSPVKIARKPVSLSSRLQVAKSAREGDIVVPNLNFDARPLPMESASLTVKLQGSWRMMLRLKRSIEKNIVRERIVFEKKDGRRARISDDGATIWLSYRTLSKLSLKTFISDILKLRVNCSLHRGVIVQRNAGHFRISHDSKTGLSVGPKFQTAVSSLLSRIKLRVSIHDQHISIDSFPSLGNQRGFLEEVVNATKHKCGEILTAFLHIAIPLGVAVEAFRKALGGKVKIRSCLRLRVLWAYPGGKRGMVALDFDGRNMSKGSENSPLIHGQAGRRIVIVDAGRAGKTAFDEIAKWNTAVEAVSHTDAQAQKLSPCSIRMRIERLPEFLKALIKR